MTQIQPPYKTIFPPSLSQILQDFKLDILKNCNCVRVGVVEEYDPGGENSPATVTMRIAQTQVTSVAPDGTRSISEYPLLLKVPVWFMGGGPYTATFPIAIGDEGVILFNDRELDNWLYQGAGQPPTTGRLHDLSDGIALIGLRSAPRALAGISTTAVQIRSNNYTSPSGSGELLEIGPGKIQVIADEVVIHARTKLVQDAGGTGSVITPSRIDTYTDTVPSFDHLPDPPGVPT